MDISKFTNNAPGKLVPITATWGEDHSFVPDDLPPPWEMTTELWILLAEAKQQIGILEGLGRNLPNPALLLRPLADREAILSSRLEGTFSTPKEFLLFELEPKEPSSKEDRVNDHLEVFNYRQALRHGTQSELPICNRLIKQMHEVLMQGVRGGDKSPGQFRRKAVGIGWRGRFIPPPENRVDDSMDALTKYCNLRTRNIDPIIQCFLVHYQFETIHPFTDGNGRVGRLLLAIMLQKCCFTKPWLYMSDYFERNNEEYVERLFDVSAKGEWIEWIEFCLDGVITQTEETVKRCDRLRELREDFLRRISGVGGSVRLNEIVDCIFNSPFIRVSALPDLLNISYPTAKTDVKKLEDAGILKDVQDAYPRTLYSPEVFDVAYDRLDY